MIVFLDTNIVSLLCNPNQREEAQKCETWFLDRCCKGVTFFTSDICDYEIRRGLELNLLSGRTSGGLPRLDRLRKDRLLDFLPVTPVVLDRAAKLWAESQFKAKNNKEAKNIDADIIITAQVKILEEENLGRRVVIATTNVKDFSAYCEADNWRNI